VPLEQIGVDKVIILKLNTLKLLRIKKRCRISLNTHEFSGHLEGKVSWALKSQEKLSYIMPVMLIKYCLEERIGEHGIHKERRNEQYMWWKSLEEVN
jgi:hypothetical protein